MHDHEATTDSGPADCEAPGIRIRRATAADAPVIARHRAAMFADMGQMAPDSADAAAVVRATERLVARAIPDAAWTGWIAEDASGLLGSGGALLRLQPPSVECLEGGELAYLLNFYTEPRARRRGVATALVRACLDWCEARGVVRVALHASAAGRRVYERLGFVPREGEMIWRPARPA